MDNIQNILIPALRNFPSEYGSVRTIFQNDDRSRFFLVYEDNASSASTTMAVYEALLPVLWTKTVGLIGMDGWFDYIDCTWFMAFPDAKIRKQVGEHFARHLQLRGAELCRIVTDHPFALHGVDDKALYSEALRLWRCDRIDEYLKLQEKRAAALLENLIRSMAGWETRIAALTVCGNLPDMVAAEMERRGHSYAVIRPKGFEHGTALCRTSADKPGERERAVCCNVSFAALMGNRALGKKTEETKGLAVALDEFGYPEYDPTAAAGEFTKGQALFQQGKYQESICPFGAAARMYTALCYSRRQGIAVLEDASTDGADAPLLPRLTPSIPLDPQASPEEKAEVLSKTRDIAERMAKLASVAEHSLGLAFLQLGEQDEALLHWDKAIEINPNCEAAWANRAAVYIEKGQYQTAIECCDKAIALKPDLPNPWYNKFSALIRLGKQDEAHECFETFRRLSDSEGEDS